MATCCAPFPSLHIAYLHTLAAISCVLLQAFYVMRYRQHDKYDPHMDVYDPAEYGPQKTMRMATLIVYLSEPEGGGETAFMREGKDGE
jgi:hypothetical protein